MGREEGKKILFGTVAGAFVLAFFWTILTTTIQYQTVNLPYWSYIVEFTYAGAAIATIFAAIEFIRGTQGRVRVLTSSDPCSLYGELRATDTRGTEPKLATG